MRLTNTEIVYIQEIFKEVFQKGEIYLFGSRVDDTLKGGDIDLFVSSNNRDNYLEKKLDFLTLLKQKIGDQKIDLVISKDKNRLIEKEAITKGISLCKI
jgi:predicted nucleotidyltransferase